MTYSDCRLVVALAFAGIAAACGSLGDGTAPPPGAPGDHDGGASDAAVDSGPTPIDSSVDAASIDDGGSVPTVPLNGPLPPGRYSIQSVASGHCLDVAGGSKDDGARVVQSICNAGPTQTFDVFSVTSKHSRILDVA